MADISHLEKMGRELKCPICLSLLNSAISLTCNHVFCNACIQTTMKSRSNCPVCKVPFHRREIRPALHMDNLVNIYKNMEVASGVNIFVSQANTSSKLSGENDQSNDKKTCVLHEKDKTVVEAPDTDNPKRRGGKRSKKSSECNKNCSGLNLIRPSFPTKKRVQVPQYPPSKTPPPTKLVDGNGKSITNETQKPLVVEKDKSVVTEKGEPVLLPFFWLRDIEDVERSSQQTDGDTIMDTPPSVPCFSDIKDSDDEAHVEISPKSGTHTAANGVDLFDSEMFNWTQRACSPELCSSPFKTKSKDTLECVGVQEKTQPSSLEDGMEESAAQNRTAVEIEKGTDKGKLCSHSLSPPYNETTTTKGIIKPIRSKALRRTNKKQAKKLIEVSVVQHNLQKAAEETMKNNQDNAGGLKSKKKDLKNKNKSSSTTNGTRSVEEDISTLCGAKRLRKSKKSVPINFSTLVDQEKHRERSFESPELKTCNKRRKRSLSEQNKYCSISTDRQRTAKCDNAKTHDEALHLESANTLIPMDNDGEATPSGTKVKKCERKCDNKLRGTKKVKFSEDTQPAVKENVTLEKVQKRSHTSFETEKSALKLSDLALRKCEASHNKIECAFCRSAEESEVSGGIVSYLNGKPVNKDVDGIQGVIHVHKLCAEWAPNVYFEDDDVINLESELKRSRRITCFFCGVKGAALGCYETSCRKSFHVPCAKLTPECRWDNDNFVMLCPLHANSKLPCEVPCNPSKTRKSTERSSFLHQPKVSATPDNAAASQWKPLKKNKSLVLCSSALNDDEKVLVSSFRSLFGVTLVKTWDLSVTHVIASTDEKGGCRRTLKYLMGVLAGKWILSIEWIIACVEATKLVDEQQYEIKVDTHGIMDGPKLGRLRVLNKQPKLFNGYKFFFMGDFSPSYKSYLHDLVTAAGGIVLNRKPVAVDQEVLSPGCPPPFIIYGHEQLDKCEARERISILARRRSDADALAGSTGAVAVSNSWILNCIAGSKLLELE